MKYQGIIFDCDGVLVDSETLSNSVLTDMAREHGSDLSMEMMAGEMAGQALSKTLAYIESSSGKPVPEDFEPQFRRRTFAAFDAHLQPIVGAPELVASLTIPFCVASSGPANKITRNLKTTGLLPYFEGKIFSCYDIKRWKPDPAIFLHAAQEMGFEPTRCAVIEDTPNGVKAGLAGGFEVYAICKEGVNDNDYHF